MKKPQWVRVEPHAQERIRQRFGIDTLNTMRSWATAKINDGKFVRMSHGRKIYHWGDVELVVSGDGKSLITVKDLKIPKTYAERLESAIMREARKLILVKEREFRKAEINVAEITLNMLKARNPKIKALLKDRLTKANDEKEYISTEIDLIKRTTKQYGVEL